MSEVARSHPVTAAIGERWRRGVAAWRKGPVPLAWRNLTADRKQLLRSTAGIAFAVLLMLMQLGFQRAFVDSTLNLLRLFDGDIVIVSATKYSITWLDSFPRRRLQQALAVPGVESANAVYMEENRSIWKNAADNTTRPIQVIGFDPDRPVFRSREINAARERLKHPNTVLMDGRSRGYFGPRWEGLESELARRNIRVVGTFSLGPDFTADGRLIMSDRNFLKFFANATDPSPRLKEAEYGIVKVKSGFPVTEVLAELRRILPKDILVLTKNELIAIEEDFQNKVTSVGPIFGLGVMIGFVVGMLISYQIMYTDLSEQMPQYATLKAIGYRNSYLVRIVLQQAIFFALAGYIPALVVSTLLYALVSEVALLPMHLTASLAFTSLTLTAIMCVLSGALAVRRILTADPAEVF